MTETEWWERSQLAAMLTHVHRGGCSDRKLQLAAVAFCRQIEHLPLPPEWRAAVDGVEGWVEGCVPADRIPLLIRQLEAITDFSLPRDEPGLLAFERFYGLRAATFLCGTSGLDHRYPLLGLLHYVKPTAWNVNMVFGAGHERTVKAAHCRLVRDIFGNPFQPVTFDPSWRTEAVVGLARGMYESRDFGPMPVLADALEDAGCASDDILAHCRNSTPHVRGCWVVDLVLGKA